MIESAIERSIGAYCQRLRVKYIKLDPTYARGIPDRMLLLPGGKVLFFELKTPAGVQSFHQKRWQASLENLGFEYYLVSSVEQGRGIIDENL